MAFLEERQNMSIWFFPLSQTKHFVKRTFMKGIKLNDKNARSNALAKCFSQIVKASVLSLPKVHSTYFIICYKIFHQFYSWIEGKHRIGS
jgi:hypothetical protein